MKERLLATYGRFTWMFGDTFFIETDMGNFVWKDPDYNGDNSMTLVEQSYAAWVTATYGKGYHGRDKGLHSIEKYCGTEFTLRIPQ